MSFVVLEFDLRRLGDDAYAVEARLFIPGSDDAMHLWAGEQQRVVVDYEALLTERLHADSYGEALGRMLFVEKLAKALVQARAAAQAASAPLRVRLRLDPADQDLQSLAWETLIVPGESTPLALSERMLFSRYLASPQPLQQPLINRLPRVLVAIANPRGLEEYQLTQLNTEQERLALATVLGDHPMTLLNFELGQGRASLESIAGALRDGHDILIVIAHGTLRRGTSHYYLWLENPEGGIERVRSDTFVDMLTALPRLPALTLFLSCQSAGQPHDTAVVQALAPRLALAGVPAVIGMSGNIASASGSRFLPLFFQELLRDGQVDRAVAAARGALRQSDDWWMPVLITRTPDGRIWADHTPDVHPVPRIEVRTGDVETTGSVTGVLLEQRLVDIFDARVETGSVAGTVTGARIGASTSPSAVTLPPSAAAQPRCATCGTLAPEGNVRFCMNCGTVLQVTSVEPVAPAAPAPMRQRSSGVDFTAYVHERAEGFVGRVWLLEAISTWLDKASQSHLLAITGPPGCGKSAVAAQLAQIHYGKVSATYNLRPGFLSGMFFCSTQDDRWLNPLVFIETIALQLARRYPEFARALVDQNADQQIVVSVQTGVVSQGGQVQGVVIERIDMGAVSPEDAFVRVLREPLEAMAAAGFQEPIVLLIDALDESLLFSGKINIAYLIERTRFLPAFVRLIVTTRIEGEIAPMLPRIGATVLKIDDRETAAVARHDIEEFLRNTLSFGALAGRLAANLSGSAFVRLAADKSDNNFLYLRYLLIALSRDTEPISLESLEALPAGLDGIYTEFLRRLFRGQDVAWQQVYAPLLGLLCVARGTLTEAELARLTNASDTQIRARLKIVRQLLAADDTLPQSQRTYAIYHRSFANYLLDQNLAGDYWCDARTHHRHIADSYRHNTSWSTVRWEAIDDYGLRHLATHLYELRPAPESLQLFELIHPNLMRELLHREGSYQTFRDITAMAMALAVELRDQGLIHLVRSAAIYATIGSVTDEMPLELIGVLAQLGQTDRARGLAALVRDPLRRYGAYRSLAEALLLDHEAEQASEAIQEAHSALSQLPPSGQRNQLEDALATLAGREATALRERRLTNALEKITGQLRLILDERDAGETISTSLTDLLFEAYAELSGVIDPSGLHTGDLSLFIRSAERELGSDDYISASRVASEVAEQRQTATRMSIGLSSVSATDKLSLSLYLYSPPGSRGTLSLSLEVLGMTIITLCERGYTGLAIQATENLGNRPAKVAALTLIVRRLVLSGSIDQAKALIDRAFAITRAMTDPFERTLSLSILADAYAYEQQFQAARTIAGEALAVARAIDDLSVKRFLRKETKQINPYRVIALNVVADLYLSIGDHAQGIAIAREAFTIAQAMPIHNQGYYPRMYLLLLTAKLQRTAGAIDESLDTITQAFAQTNLRPAQRTAAGERKLLSWFENTISNMGLGWIAPCVRLLADLEEPDLALAIAMLEEPLQLRAYALRHAAVALARTGRYKDAAATARLIANRDGLGGNTSAAIDWAGQPFVVSYQRYAIARTLVSIAEIQAAAGQPGEALELLKSIVERTIRDSALAAYTTSCIQRAQLKEAQTAIELVADGHTAAQLYGRLALAFQSSGDSLNAQAGVRSALMAVSIGHNDNMWRRSREAIAHALSSVGRKREADEILHQIDRELNSSLAGSEGWWPTVGRVLGRIGVETAQGASRTYRMFQQKPTVTGIAISAALSSASVLWQLAHVGKTQGRFIRRVTGTMQLPGTVETLLAEGMQQSEQLINIALILAFEGDLVAAITRTADETTRASFLSALAPEFAARRDIEKLQQILNAASEIRDEALRHDTLVNVTQAWELISQPEKAIERLKAPSPFVDALVRVRLAHAAVRIGKKDLALQQVNMTLAYAEASTVPIIRLRLLGDIAGVFVSLGQPARALQLADTLLQMNNSVEALDDRLALRGAAARTVAQLGQTSRAVAIARAALREAAMVDRPTFLSALSEMADVLAQLEKGKVLLQMLDVLKDVKSWWVGQPQK